jgi:hypothetical protein
MPGRWSRGLFAHWLVGLAAVNAFVGLTGGTESALYGPDEPERKAPLIYPCATAHRAADTSSRQVPVSSGDSWLSRCIGPRFCSSWLLLSP